ncbi:MAG: pirin family protein [Porticoccaceae bacterium]
MSTRTVRQLIRARDTADGAGVKLRRSLGQHPGARLDPFLMLDEFYSDDPGDYIAGFPSHPHRGFETVTYMLAGHMLHQDHLGNRGDLRDGGAQWMTAGRGVIHSEMPQQSAGLMRGFQLWINLPAAEKMQPARYRDVQAEQIPRHALPGGGEVVLLAGRATIHGEAVTGFFNGRDGRPLSTDPLYLDLRLGAGEATDIGFAPGHQAFVYVYEGEARIAGQAVGAGVAGLLADGDGLRIEAPAGARALLLAARPIGEPVVQYGPFVMNSEAEIEQALRDYRDGVLAV